MIDLMTTIICIILGFIAGICIGIFLSGIADLIGRCVEINKSSQGKE